MSQHAETKQSTRAVSAPDGASNTLLSSILNSSLDVIMAFRAMRDGSGEIVDFEWQLANEQARQMRGFEERALRGRRLTETMPHLAEDGLFDAYVRVVETGQPHRGEHRFEINGEVVWLQIQAVRCGNGFAFTGREITERKLAEQKLRESEHRFRLLAENMTDLVCLHDLGGRFLYLSPSAERILGYTPEELTGMDSYELVHPEDTQKVRMGTHRLVLSGDPVAKMCYRVRRKSGEFIWVESSTKPIRDVDGEVFQMLTSSREVTDRVRAEEALARTNEELQQRNRELQDFAYVASHDLQEPLRKVRAFADLLREEYSDAVDEMGQHYLERMQDGARRMSGLISDLLALSRITTQGQPFEKVDLNQVVEDVRFNLELQIEETNGSVQADKLPCLEADPAQMRQLLQNLISNGLKFHRPDVPPRVQVTADIVEEEASPEEEGSRRCRIFVKDNGIGFDPKYAKRIFTPFQRLHGRGGDYDGTGMGLAICRRIVERHQGAISTESTPGQGSTFIVTLPTSQTHDSDTEDHP